MLDEETYRKEIVRMWDSIRDDEYKGLTECDGVENCKECAMSENCNRDEGSVISLMNAFEHIEAIKKWSSANPPTKKYKVSQLEYDILKYISDNTIFIYIARDENGKNYIFEAEPRKLDDWWYGCGLSYMRIFDELFQFVQWEDKEPTSIQEVLKNCEVMEHDD